MSKIFAIKIIALISSTLLSIILAKNLSPEAFGKIQYLLRLVDIGIIFSNFGLKEVIVKKIRELKITYEGASDFVFSTLLFTLLLSFLIALILNLFVVEDFSSIQKLLITILCVSKTIIILNASHILGLGFRWQSTLIGETLIFLISLPIFIYQDIWTFDRALIIYSISNALIALISICICQFYTKFIQGKFIFRIIQDSIKPAKYIFIVGLVGVCISNLDTILVGQFIGFENAGIYSISVKLGALISIPLLSINTNLSPLIAQNHFLKKKREMNMELRKNSRIATYLGFSIFLFLIIFGKYILRIWGDSFEEGYYLILIIGFSHLINTIIGPAGLILNLCGKESIHANLSIASLFALLIISIPFTIFFGIIGTAASFGITIIISNILKFLLVKKHLNYKSSFLLNL